MPVRAFILPATTQWAGSFRVTPSAVDVTASAAVRVAEVIVVLAKVNPLSDVQFASLPGCAAASWGMGLVATPANPPPPPPPSPPPPQAESMAAAKDAVMAAEARSRFGRVTA